MTTPQVSATLSTFVEPSSAIVESHSVAATGVGVNTANMQQALLEREIKQFPLVSMFRVGIITEVAGGRALIFLCKWPGKLGLI
jgi:hypothetical protein